MENTPMKTRTLFNPTSDDLSFKWGSAVYVVKAGEISTPFLEEVAIHGAKKLADKNVLTSNPDEHKVLMGAYIENSEPEVIAKNLGIDLAKIRKEALTKEKEKARVVNLESQVATLTEAVKGLTEKKEEPKEEEKPKEKEEPPLYVSKKDREKEEKEAK